MFGENYNDDLAKRFIKLLEYDVKRCYEPVFINEDTDEVFTCSTLATNTNVPITQVDTDNLLKIVVDELVEENIKIRYLYQMEIYDRGSDGSGIKVRGVFE